jgi:predicted exporter
MIDCYEPPEHISLFVTVVGYVLYTLFSFGLCAIILGIGFVSKCGWKRFLKISAFCTLAVVAATLIAGVEWTLRALLTISHPLASVTGPSLQSR